MHVRVCVCVPIPDFKTIKQTVFRTAAIIIILVWIQYEWFTRIIPKAMLIDSEFNGSYNNESKMITYCRNNTCYTLCIIVMQVHIICT